ncbi:putative protease [Deinobacterium chartae]|uniref:Putative protease n=1 Tax=Deinobacterium chartae TaxID=521158 RepID=A0A841HXU2_9DEIO|nr:U32 family peptidase [Deinobacterium chartae]MBB6097049.1 putative protease [Deinobacterium chartae]
MSRAPVKPELMSPVGGIPQLKAAVEAGADAVFFGLNAFSARAKVGFTLEELPEVMAGLRERGVKGFVTFNTLVFDRELREAERFLEGIAQAGVDAVIVQDLGVARLAHQIAPALEVHGSTQMSITSAEGAELARRFGVNRVVLGRELSLRDIERIARATDVELEVFVHGALCVSYSGQCFSSEAWGGRSANRGQCAQACRLPYDLIVDDRARDLGDASYLLSPGDLYALHQVPELIRIGIDCFKIEGRYKDAEYVALTTAAYRKAIDEAWAGRELSITPAEERDLEQVYSRGLGPHFMAGTNHQKVVRGRAPRHRGVKVGEVIEVTRSGVRVRLEGPGREQTGQWNLKPGDGLVFDAAGRRSPEEREEGGSVYELWDRSGRLEGADQGVVELRFGRGAVNLSRVAPGDWVWRSSDPTLPGRVRHLTEAADPVYTRPVHMRASGRAGEGLQLELTDAERPQLSVRARSETPLQPAQKRALDAAALRENLGKLGGTGLHLADLDVALEGELFLPLSELNALRRRAVEALLERRRAAPERVVTPRLDQELTRLPRASAPVQGAPRLHLLVRTPEQLEAALELRPDSITLDYLELYGLRPAVESIWEAGLRARVASPRILKPTEQNIEKFLLSLGTDLLVRSGGLLESLSRREHRPRLIGDFSLNAANVLTLQTYLELGLEAVTPTHDLNALQIEELARESDPARLEVVAYQHLPVFHTEHCVFCRFLSSGTDYTNCGHPCEQHKVALRDRAGRLHPVMADVGCRNTVFGAQAQIGAKHLQGWLAAGLRDFRLEFVHESAADVRAVTEAFRACFAQQIGTRELERRLAEVGDQGVTEGSLFVPQDFAALPQLM